MTGSEIFSLVTAKRALLEDLIDPTSFVLNPEIENVRKEIEELQKNCPHEFINGECKYCGKEE